MPRPVLKKQCIEHLNAAASHLPHYKRSLIQDLFQELKEFIDQRLQENPRLQTYRIQTQDYLLDELDAVSQMDVPKKVKHQLQLKDELWQEMYLSAFSLSKLNLKQKTNRTEKKHKKEERDDEDEPDTRQFKRLSLDPQEPPVAQANYGYLIPSHLKIMCQVGDAVESRISLTVSTLSDSITEDQFIYTRHLLWDRLIEQVKASDKFVSYGVDLDTIKCDINGRICNITSQSLFHSALEEVILNSNSYDGKTKKCSFGRADPFVLQMNLLGEFINLDTQSVWTIL